MKKFEYEAVVVEVSRYGKYGDNLDMESVNSILFDRSKEGWELVSAVLDNCDYVLFFKKEELNELHE